MKQKLAFLFIALLINSDIFGWMSVSSYNKIVNRIDRQRGISAFIETTETGEGKKEVIVEESEQEELTEEEIDDSHLILEEKQNDGKGLDEKTENEESAEMGKVDGDNEVECIYNVAFPTNSKAYLDPENLSGRGQIFSDDFKVENYGNTDIAIKIKNIDVFYRTTEEVYELTETKVSDMTSDVKKINVDVVWKNEIENTERVLNVIEGIHDEYVLVLKASSYDANNNFIGLNEGSIGSFYFTGTVNSNPELSWEDSEVIVSFEYEMIKIEDVIEQEQVTQEVEEKDKTEERQGEQGEQVKSDTDQVNQGVNQQNKPEYEAQETGGQEDGEQQTEWEEQGVSDEGL